MNIYLIIKYSNFKLINKCIIIVINILIQLIDIIIDLIYGINVNNILNP